MTRPGWQARDVRLSVTIMHHPARDVDLETIVEACRPLSARVVHDPDPDAARSPLRTAKVAWASIAEGATHHLVLQDDARLCDDFAAHVVAAIASRPAHGIALYTDWSSPQNSYLSRLAAVAGSPWAPLSPMEWTPALAFLLPTGVAADLAGYLAPIPDEVTDDDQMISRYCRERGVPLLASVPHLVDNRGLPTLIDGHGGRHHATVWAPPVPSATHWDVDPRIDGTLASRSRYRSHDEYVVRVKDSRCLIRLLRPDTGEPGGNEFCWYWEDWCDLVGVSPDEVTTAFVAHLDGLPGPPPAARAALEIWAAGYLLGLGAAAVRRDLPVPLAPAVPARIRAAVSSWVDSGLTGPHGTALGTSDRTALIDLGAAAVTLSLHRRSPNPFVAAGVPADARGEDTRL
ncbi:hypothetical protein [Actinoplanes awajinensis]|uniref:hypothetical protein n=1 Tax=Actinoplanes awajinensis TaxID=135946 RepID=UPI000AA73EBE|nr:hypothetical protein [Actinoplanes awajinensis]